MKLTSFTELAEAVRIGANATASMSTAKAGRSSYLRAESLVGVIDSGAEAVARIFEGLVFLDVSA